MQTGTQKGMQTMEQALGELVLRRIVTLETALSRSSRPEQLLGLLERNGFDLSSLDDPKEEASPLGGLRVAGS
jgi:Tfp pilus assembly ATPase PilU